MEFISVSARYVLGEGKAGISLVVRFGSHFEQALFAQGRIARAARCGALVKAYHRETGADLMKTPPRPIAFVLASTDHGTLLVNRNDYRIEDPLQGTGFGVGYELFQKSSSASAEVRLFLALADCRRGHFGCG